MTRRSVVAACRSLAGIVSACVLLFFASPLRAEPPAAVRDLASRWVDDLVEVRRIEARQSLGTLGHADLPTAAPEVDPGVARALTDAGGQLDRELSAALDRIRAGQKADVDKVIDVWKRLRALRIDLDQQQYELKAGEDLAGRTAFLISSENRMFWLASLLAVYALAAAAWHDRRQEIRRVFNGGQARSLGVARVLTVGGATFTAVVLLILFAGEPVYRAVAGRSTGLAQPPLESYAAAATATETRCAQLRETNTEAVGEVRAAAAGTVELASLRVYTGEQVRDDAAEVLRLDRSIEALRGQRGTRLGSRERLVALLGAGLSAVVALGAFFLARNRRQRRRLAAYTCPLCLRTDTLGRLKKARVPTIRCGNPHCKLEFPARYRRLGKLSFPTFGRPFSGKTHWLAMTYRELVGGTYAGWVDTEPVQSSKANEINGYVREILEHRLGTSATPEGDFLRLPVMFDFRDHDPFGRSNVLVNLYDLPGEVTDKFELTNELRARALDSDGFLFFLDPTVSSKLQGDAITRFVQDLRSLRNYQVGEEIRAPVALVVPKIDLLVNQTYAKAGGSQNVAARFLTDLCAIEPTGRVPTLDVIRRRSELTARLRQVIWPGWEVERRVGELFGGRVMFFPLTPVGINEPGETDLRKRTIASFALAEPLLWLIHMNGYPVLK